MLMLVCGAHYFSQLCSIPSDEFVYSAFDAHLNLSVLLYFF